MTETNQPASKKIAVDRHVNTDGVVVGQEVAVWTGHSHLFGWTVTKVTPSGQVVVERRDPTGFGRNERRFGSDLLEMHAQSTFRRDRLVIDVAGARAGVERERRCREAAAAVLAVQVKDCRHTYPVETMRERVAELRRLLEVAEAKVQAVDAEVAHG